MAAPTAHDDEIVYCAISNIPKEFHSKDLRNYFSQFLEAGGFECFHFKHRPERKAGAERESTKDGDGGTSGQLQVEAGGSDSTATTGKSAKQELLSSFLVSADATLKKVRQISYKEFSVTPSAPSKQAAWKLRLGEQNKEKETFLTTCCVVKLRRPNAEKLFKMYRQKYWVDSTGSMMSLQCHICNVGVIEDEDDEFLKPSEPSFVRQRTHEAAMVGGTLLRSTLARLPELHPPDIMPRGNVGTPTAVFGQMIRECRLPPKICSRLGIVFAKSRSNRRYGNVPLRYKGTEVPAETATTSTATNYADPVLETVETSRGDLIFGRGEAEAKSVALHPMKSARKRRASTEAMTEKKPRSRNEGKTSPPKSESEDSGEEWDRHEALHNDVTNQERTTERLFENDMEVTWDKGSSGLVFYTDAAFWDKQAGDFDEKTSDDWDVDMSVYTDPNGGDKDARDFIQMRREQRLLQGLESTSAFSPKGRGKLVKKKKMKQKKLKDVLEERLEEDEKMALGEFDKHTKGFGRKLMKAQGWVEGEGLGKSRTGINEALHNEGQGTYDKSGFGYLGEKLTSKQKKQRKRQQHQQQHTGERKVIITTVYDDPKVTDPAEPLLRSQGPYQLKYRDEVAFTKASGSYT